MPWQLALYANGHDVDTVLVDGRILKEHGRVIAVDVAEIVNQARAEAAKAYARMDVSTYLDMTRNFWRGARY